MKTYTTRHSGQTAQILITAGFLLLSSSVLFAQQPDNTPAAHPSSGSNATPSNGVNGPALYNSDPYSRSSTGSNDLPGSNSSEGLSNSQGTLTSNQIAAILQQKPEVIIELKSMLADQLTQQGVNTQADAITDEMLYTQISRSADLRSSVTLFLRARGYVSESDQNNSFDNEGSAPSSFAPLQSDGSVDSYDALTRSQVSDSSLDGYTLGNLLQGSGMNGGATTSDYPPPIAAGRYPNQTYRPPSHYDNKHRDNDSEVKNITDSPAVLRRPTPYNLLSLRDLYTQIPADDTKLKRFGSDVFLNRNSSATQVGNGSRQMPIDLPIGPDYVLGSGDGLTINIWGGVSQSLNRVVDREGKIVLPEAGTLVLAGLTLQQAQAAIEGALSRQFHDPKVSITIARMRTVRVYVVGDVQRPGAYDLSSLSTPLNALYAAGGPTSVGSLRVIRHYRGKELVREDDLYDFLLHGVRMDDERLLSGDTLMVPPVGPQVAVSGMVRRPAIYELKGDSTLASILNDAGGATVAAALDQITIERIHANTTRESIHLNIPADGTLESTKTATADFHVRDGDRVRVGSILPYSQQNIYVEGHVVRPGKFPYHEGMQLNDVIRSYQDLLPEPAIKGDVIRLVAPDLHVETLQFNVADVLIGNSRIDLKPFDTIRIFGRYEVDSPQVTIRGEVLRPGVYELSEGMTAAQLVKMAGGFKRDALTEAADLTSYNIQEAKKVVSDRTSINIGEAVNANDSNADRLLKAGDVLTIHQISGWNDIGASITVKGEVTYPGSYGLQEGERLSSILRRAGGFRGTAYSDGAVLLRSEVQQLQEKSRDELIRQIETTSAAARVTTSLNGQDQAALVQAATQQQAEVLQRLRSQPAVGRLVIHVSGDIDSWANTPADIEMRSGDVLTIPKRPGFVLVSGQVYNASAITYVPGKNAGWYLARSGGTSNLANRGEIFVIRANGSVVGRRSGRWYGGDVLSTRLEPGDVVVVPQKIIGGSMFWRNLLTIGQISSSIAITAAVAGLL
jgi:protein involved in polysaccharide export with SLBB domain